MQVETQTLLRGDGDRYKVSLYIPIPSASKAVFYFEGNVGMHEARDYKLNQRTVEERKLLQCKYSDLEDATRYGGSRNPHVCCPHVALSHVDENSGLYELNRRQKMTERKQQEGNEYINLFTDEN